MQVLIVSRYRARKLFVDMAISETECFCMVNLYFRHIFGRLVKINQFEQLFMSLRTTSTITKKTTNYIENIVYIHGGIVSCFQGPICLCI